MKNEFNKSLLGLILFSCSLVLIGYGIADKEVVTVLNKAINICMECIGIG